MTTPPPSPGDPGTPVSDPAGPWQAPAQPSGYVPGQPFSGQPHPGGPAPAGAIPGTVPGAVPGQRMPGQPHGWVPPQQPYRPLPVPLAPNGLPLAGFGDRLLAYLLDGVILAGVTMVVTVPVSMGLFFFMFSSIADTSRYDANGYYTGDGPGLGFFLAFIGIWLALVLFGLAVQYYYFVEYQLRRGQTVGKRVMKLRIVPADPAAPALGRGDFAKRFAVGHLAGIVVPFFSYVDGLWQLWDKPLQQCLHDKAAKTVVVKVG